MPIHPVLRGGSINDFDPAAGERWRKRMLRTIDLREARQWFDQLPSSQRIATLSPDYCAIDALRDPSLEPVYLLYTDDNPDAVGNFWLLSAHKGRIPGSDFYDLQSPYGYGGPVMAHVPVEGQPDFFPAHAWRAYYQWCWANNIIAEFCRLHPLLDQPYGGDKKANRQTVVVPVGSHYTDHCRNKIKKAMQAGVRVYKTDSRDIILFADDYREGLKRLKADKFYFFNDAYFAALSQWDKAHLLEAEVDECGLSAAIFLEGGNTLEYHLSTTNERGRETAATNALINAALGFAENRGLKQLFLGGGKTTQPGDPLLEFKRSFGGEMKTFYVGEAIHRPETYYAMRDAAFDVPSTSDRVLFWRG